MEDMLELELWEKDKFKVWKAEKDAEMRIKMATSGRWDRLYFNFLLSFKNILH